MVRRRVGLAPEGLQNRFGEIEIPFGQPAAERLALRIMHPEPQQDADIRHAGNGATVLAAGPGQSASIAAIAELFNCAGIETCKLVVGCSQGCQH